MAFEAYGVDSGAALVVDRLVGFLFVYTRRTWLSQQDDAGARSWCGALQDPAVGPAVRGPSKATRPTPGLWPPWRSAPGCHGRPPPGGFVKP